MDSLRLLPLVVVGMAMAQQACSPRIGPTSAPEPEARPVATDAGSAPASDERAPQPVLEPQGPTDCNSNGVQDSLDVSNGTSKDENENGIPDECELPPPDGNATRGE